MILDKETLELAKKRFLDELDRQKTITIEVFNELAKLIPQPTKQHDNNHSNSGNDRAKELDGLPWKDYSNGNGAWIFRDKSPQWLLTILDTTGKSYDYNGFTYKLSGNTEPKNFVARYKIKPKG